MPVWPWRYIACPDLQAEITGVVKYSDGSRAISLIVHLGPGDADMLRSLGQRATIHIGADTTDREG